jgi:competence protein ComEA
VKPARRQKAPGQTAATDPQAPGALSDKKENEMLKNKVLNRVFAAAIACAVAAVLSSGMAQAAAKPGPSGKVNINTATSEQLTTLPGVGEKLATRIIEYRQKAGGFKSTQELMNVRGIGEKSFAKLAPHLTVGSGPQRPASGK